MSEYSFTNRCNGLACVTNSNCASDYCISINGQYVCTPNIEEAAKAALGVGVIILIAIGGCILLCVIGCVYACCCRKSKELNVQLAQHPQYAGAPPNAGAYQQLPQQPYGQGY